MINHYKQKCKLHGVPVLRNKFLGTLAQLPGAGISNFKYRFGIYVTESRVRPL